MAVTLQAVPGTGLVITPDNSGNMNFSTGMGTGNVAMTISSNAAITFNSAVNYANSAPATFTNPVTFTSNVVVTNRGIAASALPSGSVIQVVQKVFADVTSTTTAYTYVTITNGNQSITSTIANSKFLVVYYVQGYLNGTSGANIGLSRTISAVTTRLLGTDGGSGDAWMGSGNGAGSNSYCISKQYLDSPAQPAGTVITYQLLLGLWSTGTAYAGYAAYNPQSSITILEIAP